MRVRNRHGFTLIELLVVVVIIAVLIAVLLPGLARARRVAKASRCLASTRSMGSSLMIYMNDRQQAIPYNFTAQNAWTAILKEYGNTDKLRACPEVTDDALSGTGLVLPGSVTRPWN